MIQPRGTIELGDDRRELGAESPLVGAAAGAFDRVAPAVPPPCGTSCQRLDNQQSIAVSGAFDQPRQRLFSCGVGQLVERERRKNGGATLRQTHPPDIVLPRRGRNVKRAIGLGGFSDRPRMDIDADHPRPRRQRGSPCRAGRAGAAPEIDQRRDAVGRVRERADDPSDEQMVERPIEQRERGAFASAGERRSLDKFFPALDVGGRQRAQRARHFGKRQIAEMLRFERGEPGGETIGWGGQMGQAGPAAPPVRSYMQEVVIIFTDLTPR